MVGREKKRVKAFHHRLEDVDDYETVHSRTVLTTRTGRKQVTARSLLRGASNWTSTSWNLELEEDDVEIGLDQCDWLGNPADDGDIEDEIPQPPPKVKPTKTKSHWVSCISFKMNAQNLLNCRLILTETGGKITEMST